MNYGRGKGKVDRQATLEYKVKELEEIQNFLQLIESFIHPTKLLEVILGEITRKRKIDKPLQEFKQKGSCNLL